MIIPSDYIFDLTSNSEIHNFDYEKFMAEIIPKQNAETSKDNTSDNVNRSSNIKRNSKTKFRISVEKKNKPASCSQYSHIFMISKTTKDEVTTENELTTEDQLNEKKVIYIYMNMDKKNDDKDNK